MRGNTKILLITAALFLGLGTLVYFASDHRPPPVAGDPNAPRMVRNYSHPWWSGAWLLVWEDQERGIICYETSSGLSCLPKGHP